MVWCTIPQFLCKNSYKYIKKLGVDGLRMIVEELFCFDESFKIDRFGRSQLALFKVAADPPPRIISSRYVIITLSYTEQGH